MTHFQKKILLSIGLGTFVSGLNTSIVNTVLPEIQNVLHSPLTSVQWIVTIYSLILCGFILPMGRLGDLIGHKRVYLLGLLLLSIFSIGCGLSQSLFVILICRVFQAFGGAMIMAAGPSILTASFPNEQRGKVLGLMATTVYIGITLAPVLGGWITAWIGWSSIFYLYIPFTLLAMYFGFQYVPESQKKSRVSFDFVGGGLFFVSLTLFLISLNRGPISHWSTVWLSVLVLSIILILLFVWVESKTAEPMIQLKLLKNKVISFAILANISNYMAMFFVYSLIPIYLVQAMKFPISTVGSLMSIAPMSILIFASFSGLISDKIGTRIPTTIGMAVLTLGLFILSVFPLGSGMNLIMISCILVGAGSGLFTSPNNSVVFGATPGNMRGIASGLTGTARYLGQATGVTLASVLLEYFHETSPTLSSTPLAFAFQHTMLIGSGIGLIGTVLSFLIVPRNDTVTLAPNLTSKNEQ